MLNNILNCKFCRILLSYINFANKFYHSTRNSLALCFVSDICKTNLFYRRMSPVFTIHLFKKNYIASVFVWLIACPINVCILYVGAQLCSYLKFLARDWKALIQPSQPFLPLTLLLNLSPSLWHHVVNITLCYYSSSCFTYRPPRPSQYFIT